MERCYSGASLIAEPPKARAVVAVGFSVGGNRGFEAARIVLLEDIEGLGSAGWKRLSLRFRNAGYEPSMNITRIYVETERDPIEIIPISEDAIIRVDGKEYFDRHLGWAEGINGKWRLDWGWTMTIRLELPPGTHEGLWKVDERYHVIVLHSISISSTRLRTASATLLPIENSFAVVVPQA